MLTIPREEPLRSDAYLAWVRTLPCVQCQVRPCGTAHHMIDHGRHGQAKESDFLSMPICHQHHMELHAGVQEWEATFGLQPLHIARTLERAIREGVLSQITGRAPRHPLGNPENCHQGART